MQEYLEAQNIANAKQHIVEDKVARIVNVIRKFFKREKAWWWFSYYEDDYGIDPPRPKFDLKDDYFPIYISESCEDYDSSFPMKFFDMTDKEILEYLKKEVSEQAEKKELVKLKSQEKVKEKQKLKQQVLKKLSKAEKEAIGI